MIVTVSHVFHGAKCSYVNFQRTDSPDVFYNVAVAFPRKYSDQPYGCSEVIPEEDFKSFLSPGKEVHIRWSKKLSSYVVRF